MDSAKLAQLKQFVEKCEATPALLRDPELRFFRSYLERMGAKLPPAAYGKSEIPPAGSTSFQPEDSDDDMPELEEQADHSQSKNAYDDVSEDELIESDVELDNEGVVSPDNDPPQKMGDPSVEVTEEMRDNAQVSKGKAMEAIAEGDLDEAVRYLTEAIISNPLSALLYANRAGVYVKMKKPNAAIRDAEAAIKLNVDSAKGYKWRGEAKALLGQWEDAAKDLHLASKLDYDEEIAAILKKVEPNAHKLEEHRRKYDRLHKERAEKKAEKEKQRRKAEAEAAYQKAKAEKPSGGRGFPGGMPGGFGAGMPGFGGGMPGGGFGGGMPGGGFGGGMPGGGFGGMPGGGMPGGMPGGGMPGGMPGGVDMSKILNDPELMAAFQDPEVMTALQDVMKNPAHLANHQGNPKIAPIINKLMSKFGGGGAAAAAAGV